jgi:hypothetical protein
MSDETILTMFGLAYFVLAVWVFLVSYRLNMARGGRSIAGCFLRALVAAYFAWFMGPFYILRGLAARRRVGRVIEGGQPLEDVYAVGHSASPPHDRP